MEFFSRVNKEERRATMKVLVVLSLVGLCLSDGGFSGHDSGHGGLVGHGSGNEGRYAQDFGFDFSTDNDFYNDIDFYGGGYGGYGNPYDSGNRGYENNGYGGVYGDDGYSSGASSPSSGYDNVRFGNDGYGNYGHGGFIINSGHGGSSRGHSSSGS